MTTLAQEKAITKDYRLNISEIDSRRLVNLEKDLRQEVYRIWIEPDLIIEVGQDVTLTLYSTRYEKKKRATIIENIEKAKSNIESKVLLSYFDSLDLPQWSDVIVVDGKKATGVIADGNRILIEFSTREKYRVFSLYGPLTDQSINSMRTLALINFIADNIDPDKLRIEYYGQLALTSKTAKRTLESIIRYKEYYNEKANKNYFPKMWGNF